ncbi:MAG: hypothetical protein GY699_20905 [Desulfobacteraceae bacterium]|nr:hypothetical protein [Desulfobacteraceae bacterium]
MLLQDIQKTAVKDQYGNKFGQIALWRCGKCVLRRYLIVIKVIRPQKEVAAKYSPGICSFLTFSTFVGALPVTTEQIKMLKKTA